MASVLRFALIGIAGGVVIGGLGALSVPLTPVTPASADVGSALGNPAAASKTGADDQMPIDYGASPPLYPPARSEGDGPRVAYMPDDGSDLAAAAPADPGANNSSPNYAAGAATPVDDAAARAADAARDAADDARAAAAPVSDQGGSAAGSDLQ